MPVPQQQQQQGGVENKKSEDVDVVDDGDGAGQLKPEGSGGGGGYGGGYGGGGDGVEGPCPLCTGPPIIIPGPTAQGITGDGKEPLFRWGARQQLQRSVPNPYIVLLVNMMPRLP